MATTKRIDWAKAKTWFMADHTRTLGDVAIYCKANPATVRAKAGADKWMDERYRSATEIEKKATERIQAVQVDRAARCIEETITVARMVRGKVVAFLKTNLTPAELNAVMAAQDKSVNQERLALGMVTTSAEITSREGVLVIGAVMSPEDWEAAAKTQQEELTREHAG